jgi:hypothetical protein
MIRPLQIIEHDGERSPARGDGKRFSNSVQKGGTIRCSIKGRGDIRVQCFATQGRKERLERSERLRGDGARGGTHDQERSGIEDRVHQRCLARARLPCDEYDAAPPCGRRACKLAQPGLLLLSPD